MTELLLQERSKVFCLFNKGIEQLGDSEVQEPERWRLNIKLCQ